MDHRCKNPCDLCKRKRCFDIDDSDFSCALFGFASKCSCAQYECFLNYEGSCMVGLYDRCGAWED